MGLVAEVFDPDEAGTKVGGYAERLATGPALAIAASSAASTRAARRPLDEGLALEAELIEELFRSQDANEGLTAFVEKRKPEFVGA